MTNPNTTRYPTSNDHRSPANLPEAIGDYLWTIENVPGYGWSTEYDIAMLKIGEMVLRRLALPLGPNPEAYARWAEEETAAQRRRAAERRAYYAEHPEERPTPPVPSKVRLAVFKRDGHKCQRCGSEEELTLDHIIPRLKRGTNEPTNLQVLCRPCNSSKGART